MQLLQSMHKPCPFVRPWYCQLLKQESIVVVFCHFQQVAETNLSKLVHPYLSSVIAHSKIHARLGPFNAIERWVAIDINARHWNLNNKQYFKHT